LYHTHIHTVHGNWLRGRLSLPFVPGPEGVDCSIGSAPVNKKSTKASGSRYLGCAGPAARASTARRVGRPCACSSTTGYSVNGGFAEYIRADTTVVGHIPDAIDVLDAAALSCAGVTPLKQ